MSGEAERDKECERVVGIRPKPARDGGGRRRSGVGAVGERGEDVDEEGVE